MDSLTMKPEDIETESFRIIDSEAGSHGWSENEWQVVRRAIHTSADFEYAATMTFSDRAVAKAVETLKSGVGIVTDTTMALAGISKVRLTSLGCRVSCYVADNDVAELARQERVTRSIIAMRKAVADPLNSVFVIGNAPTALFELLRLIRLGQASPKLIIGLPVGFVGAEESKTALVESSSDPSFAFITNRGRKGGSNVAAAVVNALAIMALN